MTNNRQNFVQPADPLAGLAEPGEVFKAPAQVEFVRSLMQILRTTLAKCVMRDRPQPLILLQAPAGKIYSVSVSDAGMLTTTYVRG